MADYRLHTVIDGIETRGDACSEDDLDATGATAEFVTRLTDLEDDGYRIRYSQVVLDGPDGDVAIVEVEPV